MTANPSIERASTSGLRPLAAAAHVERGPHCCRTGKLRQSEVDMQFQLECEREDDGRWLAEIAAIPGVLAYGASANEAMAKAEVLALRVLAEQLEHGEAKPRSPNPC